MYVQATSQPWVDHLAFRSANAQPPLPTRPPPDASLLSAPLRPLSAFPRHPASDSLLLFRGESPAMLPLPPSLVIVNPPALRPDNMQAYEAMLQQAASASISPVSGYKVGAVALGNSGTAYLATNIELEGGTYASTVHGEQFAVALAREHHETGLKALVVTAEPCGHCRQFLLETGNPSLPIFYKNSQTGHWQQTDLQTLLPNPFTLADADTHLFNSPPLPVQLAASSGTLADEPLTQAALVAARASYTPLTQNAWAGLAVQMVDGRIVTGNVLESAAFNPTMTPLQTLLVSLVAKQEPWQHIRQAVLVAPQSPHFSYQAEIEQFLATHAPEAPLKVVPATSRR
ncbi:MAG: cytidine deaminase [Candidatus Melainabacteria bacterium]|nr:cytidine deaminase [Candidatus Melainabacteria bacterium]